MFVGGNIPNVRELMSVLANMLLPPVKFKEYKEEYRQNFNSQPETTETHSKQSF